MTPKKSGPEDGYFLKMREINENMGLGVWGFGLKEK